MKDITLEDVLNVINQYITEGEIFVEQCDENLQKLGVDSISFIQIVVSLEEYFVCEIPDANLFFSEMNTIRKIYDVLISIRKNEEQRENK